LFLVVVFKGH